MILYYIRARPAELINNERKRLKDRSFKELFGTRVVILANYDKGPSENGEEVVEKVPNKLEKLLLRETIRRDRPKAFYYKDIFLMIVRHPVTGRVIFVMSIKFIHYKGCNNKPKPYG